uniref:hypothetical protein n=1 Tax=Intrasporangium sp. TaxID=1925024 RepID=UPI003221C3C2
AVRARVMSRHAPSLSTGPAHVRDLACDLTAASEAASFLVTVAGHREAAAGHREAPAGHREAPAGHREAPTGHP